MDKKPLKEILAKPEYANLPSGLVHEILDAVSKAFDGNEILSGTKKQALETAVRAIYGVLPKNTPEDLWI